MVDMSLKMQCIHCRDTFHTTNFYEHVLTLKNKNLNKSSGKKSFSSENKNHNRKLSRNVLKMLNGLET